MTTRKSHKARGATYETDTKDWFRAHGYDAERLARTGAKDEGDVVVRADFLGSIGVIECKAPGAGNKITITGTFTARELGTTSSAQEGVYNAAGQ